MNKIFTFITMLIVVLTVSIASPVPAQEKTTTIDPIIPTGTAEDPILISNATELENMKNDLTKHYKLTADITLTGEWTPLTSFAGTLDGDGHVITGLNVNADQAGLFISVGTAGIVKNLGIIGTSVTGSGGYAGVIAGKNMGIIQNCYTSVAVTCTSKSFGAGGIAGENTGTIQNCYTTGAVTHATGDAGGIAGKNTKDIQYCYATGAINGNQAGGITGKNSSRILNCIALNESIIGTTSVGRIAGVRGNNTLTNNYAALSIPGTWSNIEADKIDGIDLPSSFSTDGANEGAFTDWSGDNWEFGDKTNLPTLKGFKTADQPVKDVERAPFLVVPVITITDQAGLEAIANNLSGSYKLGNDIILSGDWTPLGDDNATPFTGTFDGCGYTISGLNVSIIENSMTYGGLFGNIDKNGTVKNLGVTGSVTVTTTANAYAGGIAGQSNGKITNCYTNVTVNATSSNHTYAGGIAGNMANTATISNCFATGNCTATSTKNDGTLYSAVANAGGIVGAPNQGSIKYCFATGTVEAKGTESSKYAGGIAGQKGGSITGCIALNKGITGATTNRIAGKNINASTITNCYASPAISGTWNNKGANQIDGADLTEENFISKGAGEDAFTDWSGDNWDFGDNANLPKLKTTGLTPNIVIAGQADAMPTRADLLESSIVISEDVTYNEAEHKDKNIIVKSGGAFTIATSEASLKKLTIEEGGQVVASSAFTCTELLAPRTLGNQWTAYGSPVEMKAVAGTSQTFHKLSGYIGTQAWDTAESTEATSYDISKLNLIATEAAGVPVTLTATASEGTPVTIPADKEATTGASLNTGIFLFCANPTLKTVTIPVAYILSTDGKRFEQKKDAKVKPFESYMVANAATSKAVQSLRAGDTPTANEPVVLPDGSFRLWGTNGQLHLSADSPSDVAVYDLNGQLLHRFTLTGSRTLTLTRGIYLVRSNNITYKVSL